MRLIGSIAFLVHWHGMWPESKILVWKSHCSDLTCKHWSSDHKKMFLYWFTYYCVMSRAKQRKWKIPLLESSFCQVWVFILIILYPLPQKKCAVCTIFVYLQVFEIKRAPYLSCVLNGVDNILHRESEAVILDCTL